MANVVEFVIRGRNESKAAIGEASSDISEIGAASDAAATKTRSMAETIGMSAQKVGTQISSVGSTLTKGVTLPIIGAGAAALKMSADFGAGMSNVATLIPGNTERVDELRRSVLDLSVQMGKSTDDMTGGLYQVISAFGDTADTVEILEMNAKAARAGLAETTDAINLTSAVTKGYGDTSAEAVGKASDLALLTVRMGQTTFPELASAIGKVIPIAENLGVTQEEVFATMATFTGVTGSASEVTTQLRGALQALMSPTAATTALFEEHGIASGAALVKQKGLAGAIKFLSDAAEASGEPLQKYVGSVEGQTIALGLAGSQADDYKTKLDAMGKAAGTTDEAFKAATTGVGQSAFTMEQAKAQVAALMITLGDGLAPSIGSVVEAAKPLMGMVISMANAFAALPEPVQASIVTILGIVAAVGPALFILGKLVTAAGTVSVALGGIGGGAGLTTAIATVMRFGTTAVMFFGQATLAVAAYVASSVAGAAVAAAAWIAANVAMIVATGGIILAIAAVIAIVVLLVKNWDWIKEKAGQLWEWIKGVWDSIYNVISTVVTLVIGFIRENWPKILAILTGPIGLAVLAIVQNWDKIKALFAQGVAFVFGIIGKLKELPGKFMEILRAVLSVVINKINEIVNWFKNLHNLIIDALKGLGNKLVGIGKDIINGIWRGIQNGWNWLIDKVRNLAKSLLDAAKRALGIGSPSKVFAEQFGKWIPPGIAEGVDKSAEIARQAVRNIDLGSAVDVGSLSRIRGMDSHTLAGHTGNAGMRNPILIKIDSDGTRLGELLVELLQGAIRAQGGDVQLVLGANR